MNLTELWLINKIYHKEISTYLTEILNLKKIAIYGAGKMGEILYDDLLECRNIKVVYFIDKNADTLYYGIDDMDILNLEELKHAEKVDAIIVTPYNSYDAIKKNLQNILLYKPQIISLEDIICKTE